MPRIVPLLNPVLIITSLIFSSLTLAESIDQQIVSEREDVRGFINELVSKHGFDGGQLDELFREVKLKQKIIGAISRPVRCWR